jgi:hypothetical protein
MGVQKANATGSESCRVTECSNLDLCPLVVKKQKAKILQSSKE